MKRAQDLKKVIILSKRRRPGYLLPHLVCSVEDCENRAVVKGLCSKHYQQTWKRSRKQESPEKKKRGRHRVPPKPCSVEGCEKNVTAKGLCTTHYQAMRRAGIRARQPKKDLKPKPEPVNQGFGERIRSLRGQLSQVAFADAAGITQAMLSRYEAGKENPSPRVVLRIAHFCGTTIEWLLTGQEFLPEGFPSLKSETKTRGPLSRKELIDQAIKILSHIHLPETDEFTAMMKEVLTDRKRMLQVIKYYHFLKLENHSKNN